MTDRPIVIRALTGHLVLGLAQALWLLALSRRLNVVPWETACSFVGVVIALYLTMHWRAAVIIDHEALTDRGLFKSSRLRWRDIAAMHVVRESAWHLRRRTLHLQTFGGAEREVQVTARGAALVQALWLEHRGADWQPPAPPWMVPWQPGPPWQAGPLPEADPRWPWAPPHPAGRGSS